MPYWRFTTTPSGDRAVILGARLVTWGDVEEARPHEAALALERIEANGIDVFTVSHPFWGRAIPWLTGGPIDLPAPPVCPPQMPVCPVVAVPPDHPAPPGGSTAIPEPGTAGLVGLGLLLIAARWACREWGGRG